MINNEYLSPTINDHSTVCSIIYSVFQLAMWYEHLCASPVAQLVKNMPAMLKNWVRSLGLEDPLEQGTATHSSILVWRIPTDRGAWWGCKVRHDWATKHSTAWTFIQVNKFKYMNVWGTRRQLANLLSHSYILIPKLDY